MKSKLFALCAVFTLLFAGCAKDTTVHVEKIELDKTTATMTVGDHLQLNATVTPDNAADKTYTWSASDTSVVSVENGYVTALKAGQSTVTVTTKDGEKTASCAITVENPHVSSISLDKTSETLLVGEKFTLVATVLPANAGDKSVTWSATGEGIVSVSNTGEVEALKAGESTVTAKTTDGNKEASCVVTVVADSYPEGTFMAVVGNYKLVIAIGNEENEAVAVRISTADVQPKGIEYNKKTHEFSIETEGQVQTYTVGTITGTFDPENNQLKGVSADGTISELLNDVTLSRPATLLECEGTTEQLQAAFKRRYRSKGASSWSVDSNNADRIKSETENVLAGETSMSVRPCGNTFDAYGFTLGADLAQPLTCANIHFWVYNPCDYDITFRGYYYKGTNFGSNGQIGFGSADKAKAKSWTYISRGFTSSAIYNFTITVWTADQTQSATTMSARLIFDDIMVY